MTHPYKNYRNSKVTITSYRNLISFMRIVEAETLAMIDSASHVSRRIAIVKRLLFIAPTSYNSHWIILEYFEP
jgi:hypothetical protein